MKQVLSVFSVLISLHLLGQTFTDVSQSQNIFVTQYATDQHANGMSFYDFDEDGWDDITYPMNNDSVVFYRNVNGNFVQIGSMLYAPGGMRQISWVDYDNDHDLDLCVTYADIGIRLYKNDGAFNFSDATAEANITLAPFNGYGFAFADPDTDGDLDFYVAIYESTANTASPTPNLYYENQGNGTFIEMAASLGIDNGTQTSFQPVWFDADNNGTLDLHLINDRPAHADALFMNDGSPTMPEQSGPFGIQNNWQSPMSLSVSDFNNDGYQDVFKSDIASGLDYNGVYDYFKLFQNQGGSSFTNVAGAMGLEAINFGWGGLWVDVNNDAYEDLYVATGDIDSLLPNKTSLLFKNEVGTNFSDMTDSVYGNIINAAYCPVKGDIDNDGFYDIIVVNYGIPPSVLHNSGNGNHHIKITPVGTVSNRMAIGTVLKVYSNGICQTQTVFCGSGICAQNSQHKIFGIGHATQVDSVVAYFPSGIVNKFYNLSADEHYEIVEIATVPIDLIQGQNGMTLCEGDSILIGVSGYTNYNWNTGDSTAQITVTTSGTYSFEAENAAGDTLFTSTSEFIYFEPPIGFQTIVTQPPCGDDSSGAAQILAFQPQLIDSVIWSDGNLGILNDSLAPGAYDFTIISISGCLMSGSISIVATPDFSVQALTSPATDQTLGSVQLFTWGGAAPFTYYLDTVEVTDNISDLQPGDYSVTITDANGCQVNQEFTIEDETTNSLQNHSMENITIQYHEQHIVICGDQPHPGAAISVFDMTGKEVLHYNWTSNESCITQSGNLSEGLYQVRLVDINGTTSKTLFVH